MMSIISKQIMIEQGYVPATCTLDDRLASVLILSAGRDMCAGCSMDRAVCHGRPRQTDDTNLIRVQQMCKAAESDEETS
jgi:hypothetical protein